MEDFQYKVLACDTHLVFGDLDFDFENPSFLNHKLHNLSSTSTAKYEQLWITSTKWLY